ncbi:hypothetical protein NPIL_135041 [Nephila pilipes]|uniref:Uncharacterized protein n=1 Tax=Nephila pilipes TaxID=299642 RepID=A0A8X6P6F9_NEPPI|nr:hypothetical protein NPIL_135041 [Nephila pilipes]
MECTSCSKRTNGSVSDGKDSCGLKGKYLKISATTSNSKISKKDGYISSENVVEDMLQQVQDNLGNKTGCHSPYKRFSLTSMTQIKGADHMVSSHEEIHLQLN